MSYLGLISVCPPREGSMAAGPPPTLDRPLLGSPLAASLARFTLSDRSLARFSLALCLAPNVTAYLVNLKASLCNFSVKKEHILPLKNEKLNLS